MIVMYSMNYIQTEHERVDGKMCIHTTSSLFRMYQNCKRLTSWPLSVRPDTITKQACNGHMLHLIIQKPCPEIGFIYFIFSWAQAGGLWSGESKWITYTKEMHFGPSAPQTGLTLWLPFCPLPCFWLILFNYSLFNLPPFQPTFKMLFLPHVCDNFKHLGGYRSTSNPV